MKGMTMIQGFKDFMMRGNLIDIAVAFVIGGAFATVATAFTQGVVEPLAMLGGAPNFDSWQPFGMTSVGPFLTSVVAFLIMAFVVYFGIVVPYERLKKLAVKQEAEAAPSGPTSEELLADLDKLEAA